MAESTMTPSRWPVVYLKRAPNAPSARTRATTSPRATPTLKDTPDATACAPANCHSSARRCPRSKPPSTPTTLATSQRRRRLGATTFSMASKQDGGGQTRVEERPQHVPVGQASPGARAERHGLKSGHGHDHREQAPEPSIWHDEAEEEDEAVDGEWAREAGPRKRPGGLVPARIERHSPRSAGKIVAPDGTAGGQELETQLDAVCQLRRHAHTHGKVGLSGCDRIFELRVQEALVPVRGPCRSATSVRAGARARRQSSRRRRRTEAIAATRNASERAAHCPRRARSGRAAAATACARRTSTRARSR